MGSKTKTQKENDSRTFSEDELDAARQLVQLSCSSEEYEEDNKDGMSSEASSVQCLRQNHKIDEDDSDGGLKRKIKRFRLVRSIYSSTKPLVVEFGRNGYNNKTTRCKCN